MPNTIATLAGLKNNELPALPHTIPFNGPGRATGHSTTGAANHSAAGGNNGPLLDREIVKKAKEILSHNLNREQRKFANKMMSDFIIKRSELIKTANGDFSLAKFIGLGFVDAFLQKKTDDSMTVEDGHIMTEYVKRQAESKIEIMKANPKLLCIVAKIFNTILTTQRGTDMLEDIQKVIRDQKDKKIISYAEKVGKIVTQEIFKNLESLNELELDDVQEDELQMYAIDFTKDG